MGATISGLIGRNKTPATSSSKIQNIAKNHFRGLVGCLGFIIFFAILARPLDKNKRHQTAAAVWLTMIWFIIWQPVSIQATGVLIIFAFPMMGILSSLETCPPLFNEHVILMFVGNWILMLFNCSGIDKRIACFFLNFDESCTFSRVIAKTMVAAFFLSMISNRLLIAPFLIEMIIGPFESMMFLPSGPDFDYISFKGIICNAIAVSSTLGSLCIIHCNIITLQFKTYFAESAPSKLMEYPDIFNYLQYSAFAFPTFIVMFILNVGYHMVLATRLKMPDSCKWALKKSSIETKRSIEPWNFHQYMSVFFFILLMACFLTRWSKWMNMGWASFQKSVSSPEVPVIKDATTAAIFALILHLLPKSLNFITSMSAKRNVDLQPPKMESGLLFWKLIDKNTEYSLFFIIGAGIVLLHAFRKTNLSSQITQLATDTNINSMNFTAAVFLLGLITVVGANIMNGIGWQAMWVPVVVHLFMKYRPLMDTISANGIRLSITLLLINAQLTKPRNEEWSKKLYQLSLLVGIGCSFGFMTPYRYTTSYFTSATAHVPLKVQMKYGFASVIICFVILCVSVAFYAPLLWDPNGGGVMAVARGKK